MERKQAILLFLTIFLTLSLLGVIVVRFLADLKYARGRVLAQRGYVAQSVLVLEQATTLWPWEPRYHKDLARGYAVLAKAGAEPDVFGTYSAQEASRTVRLNPRNLVTLKSVISTYYVLAQVDSKYQANLDKYTKYALDLCVTDPSLWYLRALAYKLGGKKEEALQALEQALALRQLYPDAESLYRDLK